jgi:cell division protein FtsB
VSARAYRVAPRRSAAGRRKSRIHWDRLGRIVLVLVLFAILIGYVNPLLNFVGAWRSSHAEQSQLQALRREKSHLAAKAASLRDPSTAAEEARRLGMVAPGERGYVIRGLPR